MLSAESLAFQEHAKAKPGELWSIIMPKGTGKTFVLKQLAEHYQRLGKIVVARDAATAKDLGIGKYDTLLEYGADMVFMTDNHEKFKYAMERCEIIPRGCLVIMATYITWPRDPQYTLKLNEK